MLLVLLSGGMAFQPVSASRANPTDHGMFQRLWSRTELPVLEFRASRSWFWGEDSISPLIAEQNANGARLVQYFDKGGMQFNPDPAIQIGNPAFVMSSPLAYELITGDLASGDQWAPSGISIAGDADDASGPTYATYSGLRDAPASPDGGLLTQAVDRDGNISTDDRLAGYGVTAAYHVQLPLLDHQIASPFWSFIQSSGLVYEAAQFRDEALFEDQWSMIGLPLTEAYWSQVKYGGRTVDILVQVFERRVMTYNPNEPDGWKVQFANVGRHYVDWRYSGTIPSESTASSDVLPQQPRPDFGSLQADLTNLLAGEPGAQAVTVLDIQSGESVSVNGNERFLAACTIKIPIMIAVAQDISAGKYTAADVEHLVLPAMGPSLTWPARELLRIVGDGDVGVGVHRANDIMQSYGVERTLMTHSPGYWGEEHGYRNSQGEVENWLTTDDLAKLLSGIWNGDGLTQSERNYVLWSLTLATPFLDAAFRAPLPDNVSSFHKIGVLYQPEHTWNDAGIVVMERNGQEYAYVVAFLSNKNTPTYLSGYYLNQKVNVRVWDTFNAAQ